jgi:hypothetical protein
MCVLSAGAADSDEEQEGNDEEEEDAEGGEGEGATANGASRNGRGGSPSSSTNRWGGLLHAGTVDVCSDKNSVFEKWGGRSLCRAPQVGFNKSLVMCRIVLSHKVVEWKWIPIIEPAKTGTTDSLS